MNKSCGNLNSLPYEMKLQLLYGLKSFTVLRNLCSSSSEWNTICSQNRSVIMANIFFNKFGKLAFENEKVLKFMGDFRLVKTLADLGADIHIDEDKPFLYSAKYGNLEVVKYLVERGANVGYKPLFCSARYGHLEVVKYLVERGANIHYNVFGNNVLTNALHHLEVVRYLVESGVNITIYNLYEAIPEDRIEIIRLYLSNHTFNQLELANALNEASIYGNLKIVKLLYSHGAPIWDTALVNSARYGHLEIVKFLVLNAVNISSQAIRKSISKSIRHGHLKIAKYLLKKVKS
jgi:ankyrin repeat protein